MALTEPRQIFGIHMISPYSRTDGVPFGIAKVVGSFEAGLTGELIENNGGSQKYPWGVEEGLIKTDIKFQVKEYADWMFELFLGKKPTPAGSDSSGTISTPKNIKGTSVINSTTGIATITVTVSTGKDQLKFGRYVIKATSDDDVDIYGLTDIDFQRGNDLNFIDDSMKVAADVAIGDTGDTTAVASLGLTLTAGSGETALVPGDTAIFEVSPPSTRSMSVNIGSSSDVFPEFGCMAMAQRRANGELFEVDIYRCKGIGLPFAFNEKAWSDAQINLKAYYDPAQDGIMRIRSLVP